MSKTNFIPDIELLLPNVRARYLTIWTPKPMKKDNGNIEQRFDGTFVFAPDSPAAAAAKKAMLDAVNARWPGRAKEMLQGDPTQELPPLIESSKRFLRNGNAKKNDQGEIVQGFAGMLYVSASNTARPTIIDSNARGRTPLVEADGRPYPGCYCNVILGVYTMESSQYGRLVSAKLSGIQFLRDGDAFAGGARVAAADAFAAFGDEGADVGGQSFDPMS